MELFTTLDHVIIYDNKKHQCLWCNRIDGEFNPTHGDKIAEAWNPVCKGIVYGVIGKMQLLPGSGWKLLVITGQQFVGYLPNGVEVYNISRVATLTLSSAIIEFEDLVLEPCPLHIDTRRDNNADNKRATQQKVQQTWNTIKTGANNITEKTNIFVKDLKERDRMERRLQEELIKMFHDSRSFYYSPNGDLSNSRQTLDTLNDPYSWKQTDDRFFWNKHMLSDLIDSKSEYAHGWIIPIIQGYVQIERCFIDHLEDLNKLDDSVDGAMNGYEDEENWDMIDYACKEKYRTAENLKEDEFDLIIVSRRSRHRAGTRYKRRGVDESGHVANYVETEQIVCVLTHILSHVQVRGSVPVFWSQPGYKYRPIPQIDKNDEETKLAFSKHFNEELKYYQKQILISLVELAGREKIIADAYLRHIFEYNSEHLVYVTFDFHEYCRGMKFENVMVLTEALKGYINKLGYHWRDASGTVIKQQGVCRVNCMDCLDRTNVVQAAIAREVLKSILRKLGRLLPDEDLTLSCRRMHNCIWANSGDAISRQYAGTAAMKGDFTRTGERKMLGVMKDGYNSANRYYLNRFKDNYRQTVIDMMLGNAVAEDLSAIVTASNVSAEDEVWTSEKEEFITQLVRHSELVLIPPDEECLGGWALIDPFTFVTPTDTPQDEDVIVLLTHRAYYVARYDDEVEELFSYQRIPVECLDKIEIGLETVHYRDRYVFMRISYRHNNKMSGYFHTLRTIQGRSLEASKGILSSIAEQFLSLCRQQGIDLKVVEGKLDKRRSRAQENVIPLSSKRTLSSSSQRKLEKPSKGGSSQSAEQQRSRSFAKELFLADEDLPNISVQDTDNEFVEYHKRFSPVSGKSKQLTGADARKMSKSASEGCVSSLVGNHGAATGRSAKQASPNKVDTLLQRTKQAFGNVAPRFRELSPGNHESSSRPSDMLPFKSTFQKINDRFVNRAQTGTGMDVKNPLKILPEFRNKIQTALSSPRNRRKPKPLTDEEIELRSCCKTRILEL